MRLAPTDVPVPLPRGVLPALLSRGRMLLCLDFDGTLSEIVSHPADARPLEGVADFLVTLTLAPARLRVAIVTGRAIAQVRQMLGVDQGIMFSGTHGLELVGADGVWRLAAGVERALPELARAREWIRDNVSGRAGFVIEDKQNAIAMHYRLADPIEAAPARAALQAFIKKETPSLRILHGKKIDEVIPRGVSDKGLAIRELENELGEPKSVPVYFGDDTTDEDAFFEVRQSGIGVLVGAPRPSWARYQVNSPHEVSAALAELAQDLVQRAK